jgi:hypothetical protein
MGMHDNPRRLGVNELERRFAELTLLMYDTRVPLGRLEERVVPYLAPDIEFIDPWVHVRGGPIFKTGLRGFHCAIRFDFDMFQLHVQMNERGDGGRAIVDGVMNLRQLVVYRYPLRTILVYDFVLTEAGTSFQITRVEEMWSFGDMLQNLPLAGHLYELSRRGWGYLLAGLFWASCALTGRRPH